MTKPTILLDMDDVIADLFPAWVNDINKGENESVKVEDVKSWDIEQYFKCGNKVFSYLTSELYSKLTPIKGSQDGVKQLMSKYNVYICTIGTTYKQSLIPKYEWLEKHFPFIHPSKLILLGDKSIVKGDIMIDDSIKNLSVFDGRKLLYTSNHNKECDEYERVNDWNEILNKLM